MYQYISLTLLKMMTQNISSHIAELSDTELLDRCTKYGLQARLWRQKFLGLLPEVAKRELYRTKGFDSIFTFAFVLGGVSEKQVRKVLNMEDRLKDKPILHRMLVQGEESVNKLAAVATVATKENEKHLVSQVKLLPKSALETLARDIRTSTSVEGGAPDALAIDNRQNENTSTQLSFAPGGDKELKLDEDVQSQLLELQQKGIDVNKFLRSALAAREDHIQKEKNKLAETCKETDSRYIPEKIKAIVREEYGTKCSIKHCNKPSREIHHTQRFSVAHTHDPNYLAPMCHEHHALAHAADVKVQEIKKEKTEEVVTCNRKAISGAG